MYRRSLFGKARRSRISELYVCRLDGCAIALNPNTEKYLAISGSETTALGCSIQSAFPGYTLRYPSLETDGLRPLRKSCLPHAMSPKAVTLLVNSALRVFITLRFFGFAAVVRNLKHEKARAPASAASRELWTLQCAVQDFRRVRAWLYTAQNNCLFDSLVLAHYLLRLGHSPTFAIGVRTNPFFAHAWVQVDTYVIDVAPETVQTVTPILAV